MTVSSQDHHFKMSLHGQRSAIEGKPMRMLAIKISRGKQQTVFLFPIQDHNNK